MTTGISGDGGPLPDRTLLAGSLAAVTAYGVWGIAPIYFHWLGDLGAGLIVAHRVLWSALLLLPLVVLTSGTARLAAVLHSRRALAWLACSGLLIGSNWLLFIYAVVSARVLEASLGYKGSAGPFVHALARRVRSHQGAFPQA